MRNIFVNLLLLLILPNVALGNVSITLTSPATGSNFNEGSHISATGSSSFGWSDNSVDLIEIYVVSDNPNPSLGIITDSTLTNIYSQQNYWLGGGKRYFSTVGVDINAVRKSNGDDSTYYYVSTRPMNAATGFYPTAPSSGVYLYTTTQIFII